MVCEHIIAGALKKLDACERFDLSIEELEAWLRGYARHGRRGLAVTRLQAVR